MTTNKVQLATVHGIVAGATGKTPICVGVAILSTENVPGEESLNILTAIRRGLQACGLQNWREYRHDISTEYDDEPYYEVGVRPETEAEREDREWREWDTESRSRAYDEEAD